ncbi:hypothetical protein PG993_001008 [Apiospora rasikravindrae]|uniref:Uncharacterized protein n=1 Tax=Apiospora rasikravindrae TaxID=990691 RepID=A0ABR1UA67_9PEZI
MNGHERSRTSSGFSYIILVSFLRPKPHALVYDSGTNVVKVQTDKKVQHDEYWPFELETPSKEQDGDDWQLYLNEEKDVAEARRPYNPPRDGFSVTTLRLDRLGPWGRCLRKWGVSESGQFLTTASELMTMIDSLVHLRPIQMWLKQCLVSCPSSSFGFGVGDDAVPTTLTPRFIIGSSIRPPLRNVFTRSSGTLISAIMAATLY